MIQKLYEVEMPGKTQHRVESTNIKQNMSVEMKERKG